MRVNWRADAAYPEVPCAVFPLIAIGRYFWIEKFYRHVPARVGSIVARADRLSPKEEPHIPLVQGITLVVGRALAPHHHLAIIECNHQKIMRVDYIGLLICVERKLKHPDQTVLQEQR